MVFEIENDKKVDEIVEQKDIVEKDIINGPVPKESNEVISVNTIKKEVIQEITQL